jgi:N-acetylmuramoyl-L-alanine amidase
MKKLLFSLFIALTAVAFVGAKDLSGVKIYINPGHGGFHNGGADTVYNADGSVYLVKGNDRNVPTINFAPLDTNGFWESRVNLIKSLELKRLLENAGATVAISRVTNREEDDKPLRVIGEEANAFGADAFISVHSNAAGERARVNYFLNLYNQDSNGLGKNVVNMALGRHQATMSISYLMDNDITVWSPRLIVTEDKPFLGYSLGVLRHLNVPGFLVEGTFHDYRPETHRLLNVDYVKLSAWNMYRFYCDYFGADQPATGVVSGAVKDCRRIMNHRNYHNWIKGSHDMYAPLNGAKITLVDANGNVADTYTTDNNYNGVFVFWNVKPGKYTVKMEAEGYETVEKAVTVEAAKMCDFVQMLNNPDYVEPKLATGMFNRWAFGLNTTALEGDKYRLDFDLLKDIDNGVITITDGKETVKEFVLEAKTKGKVSQEIDLAGVKGKNLLWEINQVK